jgi:hypothetical protein
MGWTESPPAFSSVTETIADLINEKLEAPNAVIPPAHNLEPAASTQVPLLPSVPDPSPILDTGPIRPRLAYVDVFVDDFIKLCQGWLNSIRVCKHTYHTIDSILRPNDPLDTCREPPISVRKLLKGDDFWSTQKIILGWFIDTTSLTISLPPHRQDRLLTILTNVITKSMVSLKEWQKLLGELRSMSPGSRGCFSFLQDALHPDKNCISITKIVKDQLKDFLWLAKDLVDRPTHLAEIVPSPPTYFGSMDAAKGGMGGIWFPPTLKLPGAIQPHSSICLNQPILWRHKFPPAIQNQLVSVQNPLGTITNSDLELAGSIAHDDILASHVPVARLALCSFSDNSPTVAWRNKGSATTSGPAAYLLQLFALHQRHLEIKFYFRRKEQNGGRL